jgi:poly(3-hydroxybutyrate) depolymerase
VLRGGYLVVSVDHTGEAPVEFADGRIIGQSQALVIPEATRGLDDLRFVLRSLNGMPPGPRADLRRVAAFGHSLGGSSSALLMRAEPSVLAGFDLDGSIWGSVARHGVPRAFMVLAAGDHTGLLSFPETGRFLRRSQGPDARARVQGI